MPLPRSAPIERLRFPWGWLAATLGVVLLRALPNVRFPIGRDQATYCLISQGLLNGQQLYRDLWDNKPPGVFFAYAPIVKLFGPVMWAVGVADILLLLLFSFLLFHFAYRHLGAPAAALGTVASAAAHCSSGYVHAAQPESVLLVFVFAAYALLASDHPRDARRILAAGAMLAAAFWSKYNAIAFFPWVAFGPHLDYTPLDRVRRRFGLKIPGRDLAIRMVLLAAGVAALSAIVLAFFWVSGAWAAFKEAQFDVLPRYGAMSLDRPRFGAWAVGELSRQLGPWNEGVVAVALVVAWQQRELARVVPVVLGLASGLAVAILPGRFHSYYFEVVTPFFALCWGYVAVKIYQGFVGAREYLARRGWSWARALCWLVLANLVYALVLLEAVNAARDYRALATWVKSPRLSYVDYFPQHSLEKLASQLLVIDFLQAHSSPSDQVFVWGTAPLINYLGARKSPSRFVSNLALISPWGPDRWRGELVSGLEARPPRFIVVARHDAIPTVSHTWRDSEQFLQVYPALAALILSRYERCISFRDFDVYRRK